jgi:hypothetical protein
MLKTIPTTKLLSSLRHSGYNSVTSVQDVFDNSIDAGASKIDVLLRNELPSQSSSKKVESSFMVQVADNGVGMDKDTLHEALKLGSETPHRKGDLGRFGMGLLTASLAHGRQIEVLTRMKGGDYLYGLFDYDHIVANKDWSCQVDPMTDEQKQTFEKKCGDHGTLVTVRRIDRCSYTSITSYANALTKSIGMSYFEKLGSTGKLRVTVNRKRVEACDPLEPKLPDCTRKDGIIDIDDDTSISMSVVLMPKNLGALAKADKASVNIPISGSSCGLYFVRSGRLIKHKSFKLMDKAPHNSHNRLRCVVRLDETADEHMGIDFTKSTIEPIQSVIDKMKEFVGPYLVQAREEYDQRTVKDAENDVAEEVKKAQDKIAATSKLHKFPPKERKKRAPYKPREPKDETEEKPKKKRVKVKGRTFLVKYTNGGAMGQLMLFSVEDGEVVITWNVDHPFYTKYMVKSIKIHSATIMEIMQFVAFSLASTTFTGATETMRTIDDEEFGLMVEYLVSQMSDTLRFVSMDKK